MKLWKLAIVAGLATGLLTNAIAQGTISMSASREDIHIVLVEIFRSQNVTFVASPEVNGTISFSTKNATLEDTLDAVLTPIHATYRVENNVYKIVPKTGDGLVTQSFENVDIRAALREIFKDASASYTVGDKVVGNVTAELKNLPLEVALTAVLKTVNATYRQEGNVYEIRPTMKTQFVFHETPVREALAELFDERPESFTIDPGVKGSVTVKLKDLPLECSLEVMLQTLGATYRVEGTLYRITAGK